MERDASEDLDIYETSEKRKESKYTKIKEYAILFDVYKILYGFDDWCVARFAGDEVWYLGKIIGGNKDANTYDISCMTLQKIIILGSRTKSTMFL